MSDHPELMHTALDTTDCRGLAEFYRELLGLRYRPGDEPPADGSADDADWLVLVGPDGRRQLAVQRVDSLTPTTWPEHDVPMQLHLDLRVPDRTPSSGTGPGPRHSVGGSCWTAPTTPRRRRTSSPTRPGTRSVSWWAAG